MDDVFQNKNTKELHVVDYKSKSTTNIEYSEITLDGKFMGAYKRQMDFYVWVLRRKDFQLVISVIFCIVMVIDLPNTILR